MNLSSILLGIIIAQGIYSGCILLLGHKNKRANQYLGCLAIISSLWLMDSFLRVSGLYSTNPNFYFLPLYYSLGFGPLIYFYSSAITTKDFRFLRKDLLHFLPMLLQGMFYFFLTSSSYSFKRWFWLEVHRPFTYDLEFNLTLVSLIIYSSLSLRKITHYRHWIKDQYSNISKIHLSWLKGMQYLLICVCAFWLFETVLREVFIIYAQQPLSALSLGISILIMSSAGILQADTLQYGIENPVNKIVEPSDLNIDQEVLALISQEMSAKRYYLDPELTLKSFANTLNLPPRLVSNHINHGLGQTFIDFVNSYRIDLTKERLLDDSFAHLTLHAIALESGFSSKSTFNRVFKKLTGETPSNFKKKGS